VNDEAVFARAEPNWLTVRIGRDDPLSKAEFFLDSHAEVATLLQLLLELLDVG
jgi:trehalose 6-phosphate phosphatase